MTDLLAEVLTLWQRQLWAAGLVFLRVGAMMALLPAFGERTVPVRIRLVLALAFTGLLAPAVSARFPATAEISGLGPLAGIEILAGLAIGIMLRLMVVVLQMAGTIAANVISLAQVFGGSAVDPQPAMAHVLVVAGLALAAMTGLHVKILAAMIASYDLFPPGLPLASETLAEWGTDQVRRAFSLAFSLSAPFVIASLIYNLALGAINRAMPQLMVAFVGAPAITMAGLILMLFASPLLLHLWLNAFDTSLTNLGVR